MKYFRLAVSFVRKYNRVMKKNTFSNKSRGFAVTGSFIITLILLSALIIFIQLYYSQSSSKNKDEQRTTDMKALSLAIGRRISDNSGSFGGVNIGNGKTCPNLPSTPLEITADVYITPRSVGLDCLVSTYLPEIPLDPASGFGVNTGYKIYIDAGKKIHLLAETPEPSIPRTAPLELVF